MIGKFITIEGTDGSGKTTVIKYLQQYLEEKGYNVVVTREPGGVELSEKIRNLLLTEEMDARTEVLLFAASRREHIVKKILPELENGSIILCDRFVDSSVSYQAYGRQLNENDILNINSYALDGLVPDATFYFDVNIETGLERTKYRRDNNKLDNEQQDFYIRVKAGYDAMAKKYPERVVVIDANKELEEVKTSAINKLERLIEKWKQN